VYSVPQFITKNDLAQSQCTKTFAAPEIPHSAGAVKITGTAFIQTDALGRTAVSQLEKEVAGYKKHQFHGSVGVIKPFWFGASAEPGFYMGARKLRGCTFF